MRRLAGILITMVVLAMLATPVASADEYVSGHFKKDGTYVQGYFRSSPDSTPYNNYSYSGNVNPYTGSVGTKSYDPLYPSYRAYGSYPSYSSSTRSYESYPSYDSFSTYTPSTYRSYDPYSSYRRSSSSHDTFGSYRSSGSTISPTRSSYSSAWGW